jgi:hypothetical protein
MGRLGRIFGLATLGFVLGAALGLYLGWIVWPIEFTNADPTLLSDQTKYDYALMVATTYQQDGDLAAARWRLATLGSEDVNAWYLGVTIDAILLGKDEADVRRMVAMANDMGLQSAALQPYLPAIDN